MVGLFVLGLFIFPASAVTWPVSMAEQWRVMLAFP